MKWMKERDLLLAQTAAFVQSVTGKRPNIEAQTAAPVPPQAQPPHAQIPEPAQSTMAQSLVAAPPPLPVRSASPPLPVPTVIEGPPPVAAPVATATVVEVPPPAQLPQFARLDLRGDFQSEVRARVANFRANQQRFLKEREDYCSSTMAKVRAAIRDNSDLPRSGK